MVVAYLVEAIRSSRYFIKFENTQIPREGNEQVDALSKLTSSKDAELFKMVPIKLLSEPSISLKKKETLWIPDSASWMQEIISYLKDGTLLEVKKVAQKL